MRYHSSAKKRGFKIKTGPGIPKVVELADGSLDMTLGEVDTDWTFATGQRVHLTFDILENCYANIVLGQDFL